MQLTLFTDYSLRILMHIGLRNGALSNVKEISDFYGISRNHLAKVVHRLSQLGYIDTIKGKGGGIKIAVGTLHLRLGDLIEKLEPNMFIVECFDSVNNTCKITNSCRLKHYLFEARQDFLKTLNKYTLSDTLQETNFFGIIKNTSIG